MGKEDGGAGDVWDDGVGRETASEENGNRAMLVRKRGKGVRVSSPQSIAFAGWKPAPLPGRTAITLRDEKEG